MSEAIIKIQNMNKWFGDFQVLKDINLEVEKNKKIVVCGPSGSGKSTLIRCINRLEEHQKGSIVVDGTELNENTKNIEQIRAEVGMVFQQFNLFPHLSILDNCTMQFSLMDYDGQDPYWWAYVVALLNTLLVAVMFKNLFNLFF